MNKSFSHYKWESITISSLLQRETRESEVDNDTYITNEKLDLTHITIENQVDISSKIRKEGNDLNLRKITI